MDEKRGKMINKGYEMRPQIKGRQTKEGKGRREERGLNMMRGRIKTEERTGEGEIKGIHRGEEMR